MATEIVPTHTRIWKFSHGTDKTAPELKGIRDLLLEDRILTLYKGTAALGGSETTQGDLILGSR